MKDIGSSVCCDGICLTITEIKNNILYFYVSNETLKKTNFKNLKKIQIINLEKSLIYGQRISGHFSQTMMKDWANDDVNLLNWRAATGETSFEKTSLTSKNISEQGYFDHGVLMVAFVKSGVELAFETMVSAGIIEDSAYYESLHELPLIANTIARKKLYPIKLILVFLEKGLLTCL